MKVAYFIGALNRGGAESLLLDICRQHRKVPYDFVCVYRHEGNMSDAFHKSGASMIQIRKNMGFLRYLWNIRQTLLREHVTMVHSQTPSNTLLLVLALIGTGIQIITTFHGHSFADAVWWKRRLVYAASEKILCVSQYEKLYYEHKWHLPKENKLRVVYNGVDFAKFDAAKYAVENVKCNVASGRIRLCMVGNFIKGRSQMVVCEAIHKLKDKKENFDFYFIGRRDEAEPARYDECVKYCEDNQLKNVHFFGGREDVPDLLKTMDGFVYSTEHDTFGIAVIEAITAGLPIVVNDWPVMTEVCNLGLPNENQSVRFYKTDNPEDCADKMANLLDDIKTQQKQLQTDCSLAMEAVRAKYSIHTHIDTLFKIYNSLIH